MAVEVILNIEDSKVVEDLYKYCREKTNNRCGRNSN